jgi:hypothetical protein
VARRFSVRAFIYVVKKVSGCEKLAALPALDLARGINHLLALLHHFLIEFVFYKLWLQTGASGQFWFNLKTALLMPVLRLGP